MYRGGGRGGGGDPNAHRENTPRGQMSMSKASGPALAMLPPDLKPMFDPRPPLTWAPPTSKRKVPPVTSVADLMGTFETTPAPPRVPFEEPKKRKQRLRMERDEKHKEELRKLAESYKPLEDPKIEGDAYKTLFVARLSYDTSDKKLEREMGSFGPIRKVSLIKDLEGNPRGYAFVEFERESDMKEAYRQLNGKKIDGHRILVDVERGRSVRNWFPRRLGGGLGDTRKTRLPAKEERAKAKEEALKNQQSGGLGVRSFGGGGSGAGGGSSYSAGGGARRESSSGARYRDRSSSRDRFSGGDRRGGGGGGRYRYDRGDSRDRGRYSGGGGDGRYRSY